MFKQPFPLWSMQQIIFAQPVFTLCSACPLTLQEFCWGSERENMHYRSTKQIPAVVWLGKKHLAENFCGAFSSFFFFFLRWSWKFFHPLIELLLFKLEYWTYKNNFTPFIIVFYFCSKFFFSFFFFSIRVFSLSPLWNGKDLQLL